MYDQDQIAELLSGLDAKRRLSLCATCSERLLPLYGPIGVTEGGKPSFFRAAVDQLWHHLLGPVSINTEVENLLLEAKASIPDKDDLAPEYPYAQHAAIAVTYDLECWLSDNVKSVMFCLKQAYDAVDSYALRQILPRGGAVTGQVEL